MTVADFIAASYLKATGKISVLTSDDDNWKKLLQLANIYQNTWANQPGVDWYSLYVSSVSTGTVTATDSFTLDSSIHKISQEQDDPVRILHTGGVKYTDYLVVSPDKLKYYSGNYCAQNGASLKFTKAFASTDPQFSGTIKVPAYTLPATVSASTDVLIVDNPYWLVTICAAEYVRNDLVRQNQYPSLIAEANELMKKMVENNNPQLATVTLKRAATGRSW